MRKRKPYLERITALNQKAKEEVAALLHKHGLRRLDIPEGIVNVTSQHEGGNIDIFHVNVIKFVRTEAPHSGDVLCFDYRGGIAWYENPVVWCQICDYVHKALNEK